MSCLFLPSWRPILAALPLVLLSVVMPARAAEPSIDLAPPSFAIESIVVEGVQRASPEIITAETLLLEGGVYSEVELRQAVARVRRLPFVLSAEFSLRKGSERGRFQLLITIEEIRRYFFGEDLIHTRFTNSVTFDGGFAETTQISPGALAGIRFFVGRYGVLFGSVSGRGTAQVGYTRYNLFDRHVFFSLGLQAGGCCSDRVHALGLDPTFSSWRTESQHQSAEVTFGVPLGGAHSLRLQLSDRYSESGSRRSILGLEESRPRLDYVDLEQRSISVEWLFDNTDDPLFPTRGIQVTGGVDYQSLRADLAPPGTPTLLWPIGGLLDFSGDLDAYRYRGRQLRASIDFDQHWQLGQRHTASVGARLAVGRSTVDDLPSVDDDCTAASEPGCRQPIVRRVAEQDIDLIELLFTARHSVSLWSQQRTRNIGDLRWETTLSFGYDQTSPEFGLQHLPLYRKTILTSIAFRNSWGLFRFGFQIADYGGDFG